MEIDKAKNIIASFLEIEPGEVSGATGIGRKALRSSIKVHRLRSELRKIDIAPMVWDGIETFSDLLESCNIKSPQLESHSEKEIVKNEKALLMLGDTGLGIDIESVDKFPFVEDYFADTFYLENFSLEEISYCSRQENPRFCFAGRFSAKEAIYKATAGVCGKDFKGIEVVTESDGRVSNSLCDISISYLKDEAMDLAISVASSKRYSDNYLKSAVSEQVDLNLTTGLTKPSRGTSKNMLWMAVGLLFTYLIVRDFILPLPMLG